MRVSGPDAHSTLGRLVSRLPEPRVATVMALRWDREIIDEAMVLLFTQGASFTGEDVVELHVHGSPAVVRRLSGILAEDLGLRPALAGEFTQRALLNGRMSVVEVEGLGQLLAADTEAQRRQAGSNFFGKLSDEAEAWRAVLLRSSALIAASIDFADEDLPSDLISGLESELKGLVARMRKQVDGVGAAERLQAGFQVALVGAPNVGKSTLLNALAKRDAALTSEMAGTTRDVIEVQMDVRGLPVTLLDTAGVRDTADKVEKAGIERTLARAEAADLRVFIGRRPMGVRSEEQDLTVVPKADLLDGPVEYGISGQSGLGVDELLGRIGDALEGRVLDDQLLVTQRQRFATMRAIERVEEAVLGLQSEVAIELIAEELIAANRFLGELIGRIGVEDMLGEIFAEFCIGK